MNIVVLERAQGLNPWRKTTQTSVDVLCQKSETSAEIFAFLPFKQVRDSQPARSQLSTKFGIPDHFWETLYERSNGFFRSSDLFNENHKLYGYSTWFRVLVKHVSPLHGLGQVAYSWQEMGFFFKTLGPNSTVMLCFDAPKELLNSIEQNAPSLAYPPSIAHMYRWHTLLIEEILKFYDQSVWGMRDVVRELELTRPQKTKDEPNFVALHDTARHIAHSTETVSVAADVVTLMLRHCRSIWDISVIDQEKERPLLRETEQTLLSQIQVLGALRARSERNESRLRNEITLSFNIVSQRDSNANVRLSETTLKLSEAASLDNQAMRRIAYLTLLFLPATFVSAIFGTTFFSFSPAGNDQEETWQVSNKFWIFWVVSIPLTGLTWLLWRRVHSARQSQDARSATYEMSNNA